jgi:hypothetical protein
LVIMNARPTSRLLAVLAVLGLAALAWWAMGPAATGATNGAAPEVWMVATAQPGVQEEPIEIPAPQQGIGIVRVVSESFEDPAFPSITTSKWSLSDRCSIFPGRSDVIGWGRRTCDASAGSASLWSVGGGTFGKTLACGADYPASVSDPRRTCANVDTLLRYTTLDMSTQACLRVTFDYKADMPPGALRLAVGERDDEGNITFTTPVTDFADNTNGEWQRGVIRNFPEAGHKPRVVLGFFYFDASGTEGYQGATIDNVLIDAMSVDCNAPPFPSPTVPTLVPTATETPTKTPFVIPTTPAFRTATPTRTPTRAPRISMPLLMRQFDIAKATIPYKTAPPPTITPTPSNTPLPTATPTDTPPPTDTERPTRTPKPSSTPSVTPRPSPTNVPEADVQIVDLQPEPLEAGIQVEVVRLTNVGNAAQLMDNWRLFNLSHSNNCRFPAGLSIDPGASYEIRSGPDAVTDETGVACTDKYIWDNHKDEAQLYSQYNLMVSCYAYDANGPYNCMPSTGP